jgi:hypothetical protein
MPFAKKEVIFIFSLGRSMPMGAAPRNEGRDAQNASWVVDVAESRNTTYLKTPQLRAARGELVQNQAVD